VYPPYGIYTAQYHIKALFPKSVYNPAYCLRDSDKLQPDREGKMGAEGGTPRVLYFVEPDEQVVLQELEGDVLSVLSTNQIEGNATWVNKTDAANARFVQLWVATESQSTFLLEWPSSELAGHALDELRARLEDKRR